MQSALNLSWLIANWAKNKSFRLPWRHHSHMCSRRLQTEWHCNPQCWYNQHQGSGHYHNVLAASHLLKKYFPCKPGGFHTLCASCAECNFVLFLFKENVFVLFHDGILWHWSHCAHFMCKLHSECFMLCVLWIAAYMSYFHAFSS